MLQNVQGGKGVVREGRDVTDSARGKGVVRERQCYRECKGKRGRSGET